MKDSGRGAAVIGERPLRNLQERRRQLRCRRRVSLLVANDPYNRVRFGQPQHRPNEVAANRAVNPRGPDDGGQRMRRQDGRLTGQLRRAVCAQRCRNVRLVVRLMLRTIKDIIGRQMYKWNISLPCDIRQRRRTVAIDAEGFSGFGFCLVHRRIGRDVDDHAGGDLGDRPVDPLPDFQIELRTPEGHRRQAAERSEITKTTGQLAIPTSNQNRLFDHVRPQC